MSKNSKKGNNVKGCVPISSMPAAILWQYTDATLFSLPDRFKEFIGQKRLNPNKCAILARGTSLLKRLHPQNESISNPVELFANALNCWYGTERKSEDITNSIKQIGKSISYLAYNGRGKHQKEFCPDGLSGIEWRLFLRDILIDAASLYPFIEKGSELTWSQWVGKLKSFLEKNWERLPLKGSDWNEVRNKIRSPNKMASLKVVKTILITSGKGEIRTTTIHGVKGETLEAVLLVSSPDKRSQGGHFDHWLNPKVGDEEFKRFAYVACSRPRHFLVIATPILSDEELKTFLGLGLEPQLFDQKTPDVQ